MLKNELIKAVQENYITKQSQKNAMEYSRHIAKKNTCKTISIILFAIVWIILVGLIGSAELGLL